MEFEQSIKEDLALLEITPDVVTHTSDHFAVLFEYALQLIKLGKAYCDDTDVDTMRNQRYLHPNPDSTVSKAKTVVSQSPKI